MGHGMSLCCHFMLQTGVTTSQHAESTARHVVFTWLRPVCKEDAETVVTTSTELSQVLQLNKVAAFDRPTRQQQELSVLLTLQAAND
jgi:hypothetical protein